MVIVITGAAGFIGSHLALRLRAQRPDWRIIGLDNLKRRGAELNVARLASCDVTFIHGDIRNSEDLAMLPDSDVMVECSAEPSVTAAYADASRYVVNTNLLGTINCLEYVRSRAKAVVFMSTSRVYPIAALNSLRLKEEEKRFVLNGPQDAVGISDAGVSEDFTLIGARSLYGASKLCSEIMLQEYADMYGTKFVINRCGLVAGPWQWARSDQGVVALWAARHYFGGALSYIGYGGTGKQVRDVLHVDDLVALLEHEIGHIDALNGSVFNVGGGPENAVSLTELTERCAQRAGRDLVIASQPENRPGDIPYYVTDNARVRTATGWQPQKSVANVVDDLFAWFERDEARIRDYLA